MSFTSLNFLLFFPIICFFYYLIPHKWRWIFLLLVSYIFYINWQPTYALLLMGVTIITYISAIQIEKREGESSKTWFITGVVLSLLSLIIFKYYNFINENVFNALSLIGLRFKLPKLKALLPIGVSFYSFMAIGYLVDVYKRTIKAEKNFFQYALFISFFPQVTSGPIGRANQLLPQLKKPELLNRDNVVAGIKMMLWGYFMKLCMADRLGIYVDAVFNNIDVHEGTTYILSSFLYTFQIYGDFAGYSLIAIGTARVMGIRLMENFKRPYLAKSIKEFWSRWHISLSTWFRDYVYIPLGGNRVSKIRHIGNLFITFLLSGLWHGAAWTFVIWGAIHGLIQIIEVISKQYLPKILLPNFLRILITFLLVNLVWVFFRSSDLSTAWTVVSGMFTSFKIPFLDKTNLLYGFFALFIVIMKDLHDEFDLKFKLLESKNFIVSHISMAVLAIIILLFGVLDGGQFIYFQF